MNSSRFFNVFLVVISHAICLTLCQFMSSIAIGQVTVKENTATQEINYSIKDGSCQIRWDYSERERNVIGQRVSCNLPLNQQLSLIEQLLTRVLEDRDVSSNFKSLYLGSLTNYPEMRERLAIIAVKSREWNLSKGRPKSGSFHTFFVKHGNEQSFLAGWQELFQRHGLKIQVSSVEKMDVTAAGNLLYFKTLERQGIKTSDRIPSSCLMWLSVSSK